MLSRNDMTVLMQQVDVGKALDLLTKLKTDRRIHLGHGKMWMPGPEN